MSQSNVKCANFRCPIRENCNRFVEVAKGEEHHYKVFQYNIGYRGDVSCLNYQIKSYEADREVHRSEGHQRGDQD